MPYYSQLCGVELRRCTHESSSFGNVIASTILGTARSRSIMNQSTSQGIKARRGGVAVETVTEREGGAKSRSGQGAGTTLHFTARTISCIHAHRSLVQFLARGRRVHQKAHNNLHWACGQRCKKRAEMNLEDVREGEWRSCACLVGNKGVYEFGPMRPVSSSTE